MGFTPVSNHFTSQLKKKSFWGSLCFRIEMKILSFCGTSTTHSYIFCIVTSVFQLSHSLSSSSSALLFSDADSSCHVLTDELLTIFNISCNTCCVISAGRPSREFKAPFHYILRGPQYGNYEAFIYMPQNVSTKMQHLGCSVHCRILSSYSRTSILQGS